MISYHDENSMIVEYVHLYVTTRAHTWTKPICLSMALLVWFPFVWSSAQFHDQRKLYRYLRVAHSRPTYMFTLGETEFTLPVVLFCWSMRNLNLYYFPIPNKHLFCLCILKRLEYIWSCFVNTNFYDLLCYLFSCILFIIFLVDWILNLVSNMGHMVGHLSNVRCDSNTPFFIRIIFIFLLFKCFKTKKILVVKNGDVTWDFLMRERMVSRDCRANDKKRKKEKEGF